jgi:hypothetical protein
VTQTEQFDADVAAVEPEMPVIFKFGGKEYTGQRTPIADRQPMVDSGFEQTFDFLLVVRTAIFVEPEKPPVVDSEIEIEDVSYRIEASTPSQDGVTITYGVVENE